MGIVRRRKLETPGGRNSSDISHWAPYCPGVGTHQTDLCTLYCPSVRPHQTDHTGHCTVQVSELIRHITQDTVLSRCRNSSDRSHRTLYCPGVGTHQTDLSTPYCPSVRPHQADHIDPVLSQCPTSSDRSH